MTGPGETLDEFLAAGARRFLEGLRARREKAPAPQASRRPKHMRRNARATEPKATARDQREEVENDDASS